jgi:kynureninase
MLARREDLEALDRADELGHFRARFDLPKGLVYLDGNSLGPPTRAARERIARTVDEEWGRGLIRSWESAGWISLPQRTGDKIARLIGAAPGEVIVADSTSVNLFKALSIAIEANRGRRVLLSEHGNFPTDLYIAQGLASHLGAGHELVLVETGGIEQALRDRGAEVAAAFLTHVDYVSGRVHDMASITAAAHEAGAMMIWDLAHSAGAVPLDLNACGVQLAVGCGYKYLNGGPGAPAFLHVSRDQQARATPPLSGWMGHADPFAFAERYEPAPGIARFLCGTPSVIAMSALDAALDLVLEASMDAIRRKSVALGEAFVELAERHCAGSGLRLVSPRDAALRGSQVSYAHPECRTVMRILVERGVVGDVRAPDILRFGFAPLYTRYVDVWDAVMHLRDAAAMAAGQPVRPSTDRR